MERILVIGACGQIGSELTVALREAYGPAHVFATDIKKPESELTEGGPFAILDALDRDGLYQFIRNNGITQIYHLAAILSGNAEKNPLRSWDINMRSLLILLEAARELNLKRVFWPSSIAVFGPGTPKRNTPQHTIMDPNTVYGISKLAGERWIEYYFNKYGVDTRSVRYPGLISYKTEAGGGTTDYAVEIFYDAVRKGCYECFLSEGTALPMMFMDDAIKSTIQLMNTDSSKLSVRSSYNMAGISFTPRELTEEIRKLLPDFKITYKPDFRQAIADSWPQSIDDSIARQDWGMVNDYDISRMTGVMLKEIKIKLK